MKLSNQAIGAIMLALQKSLMEQSDIVPMFQNFELMDTENGVIVKNPPIVKSKKPEKTGTTLLPPKDSLKKMTKSEILQLGRDVGASVNSRQTKVQLIETLEAYMGYA